MYLEIRGSVGVEHQSDSNPPPKTPQRDFLLWCLGTQTSRGSSTGGGETGVRVGGVVSMGPWFCVYRKGITFNLPLYCRKGFM